MKRLILTMFVCFILVFSFSFNAFASGVGGSLGGIGSGIDPRTDSRYKENFELDADASNNIQYINDATYGDIVFSYVDSVYINGEYQNFELKCYFRFWYIPSDFNNPCVLWDVDSTGLGNLSVRFKSDGEPMPFAYGYGTQEYNGGFDCGRASFRSGRFSKYFSSECQMVKIIYSDFPVFDNLLDCDYYCSTNQINNAIHDPSPNSYSQELYFEDIRVVPHISTMSKPRFKYLIDNSYFVFQYKLTDFSKKNLSNIYIRFEDYYVYEAIDGNGLRSFYEDGFNHFNVSLKEHPFGFNLSFDNLKSMTSFNTNYDFNCNVSRLTLHFYLCFDNVVGPRCEYVFDLKDYSSYYSISVPDTTTDSSGNTTFVKDDSGNITYTQEGDKVTSNDYYYNKVTETNEGDTTNVTNNYYYYDKDGKEHEISEDDYNNSSMTVMGGEGGSATAEGGSATANASIGDININISNGSGEYIDISPQSYALYIDAMKTLLEELDPQGGLFLLMHDAYTVFPASIWVIVGGGLAAAVMVSLVCIARRY